MGDPKEITPDDRAAAESAEAAAPAFSEPHYVLEGVELAVRKGDAITGNHGELFPELADGAPAPQSLWLVRAHMHGLGGARIYGPSTPFFVRGDTVEQVHKAIAAHLQKSVNHQQRAADLAAEPHPFGAMGAPRKLATATK